MVFTLDEDFQVEPVEQVFMCWKETGPLSPVMIGLIVGGHK